MKIDFYTRKLVYLILLLQIFLYRRLAVAYSFFFTKKEKVKDIKSIAAVWYWPYDYPAASLTRLGKWKPYFEKDGVLFDSFFINTMDEFVNEYEGDNWTVKYYFYIKTIHRRFKQFLQLRNYDVIWIDRWFLPYYPSSDAFWEKQIKKMTSYLVVDSTDGTDYMGWKNLILDIFQTTDRISVAYEGLYDFYAPKYPNKVFRFNYTIIEDGYKVRNNWTLSAKPVIGWMGSPSNFKFLKDIEGELIKVAKVIPFKLVIICRQNVQLDIPGAEISYHKYGEDYFDLLDSFEIGLSPFTERNFGTTGKIGMKHQEFLLCQTPQVCSPQGISEHAVDHENCLIANEIQDWTPAILELLQSESLRKKVAINGRKMCLEHYTFEGQWLLAKKALTEF